MPFARTTDGAVELRAVRARFHVEDRPDQSPTWVTVAARDEVFATGNAARALLGGTDERE
jgi:hypothetical protein